LNVNSPSPQPSPTRGEGEGGRKRLVDQITLSLFHLFSYPLPPLVGEGWGEGELIQIRKKDHVK